MGGIELRDETLIVDRAPNELDELAMRFSDILDDVGIEHVFVSGYVASSLGARGPRRTSTSSSNGSIPRRSSG